jgi:multiple sugar transport system permease protein
MARAGLAPSRTGPRVVRRMLTRIGFYVLVLAIGVFFALPLAWLVFAPFNATPGLAVEIPTDLTLRNFVGVLDNPFAASSLWNSVILGVATMLLVCTSAALCAYALSRVRIPGRDVLLYILLLFSSVVTGTAAMVPIFQLMFELGLVNTYTGVVLVLAGGLLPAGIFILKDFMDTVPVSYEESARVAGASSFQILKDIVLPVVRPGLAVIGVWVFVQVWGNFLLPFILLRDPDLQPAAVIMYSFYTAGGQADLPLISAFSLLYSIPVVLMYVFVNQRYGFRFHGGIKG